MALLYDSRFRAMDDDGNPLSGATLTVYQAGTTNLVSLYTDAGLTTSMSNPTSGAYASNAAGVFPQVFMAEGVLVDVILKDSGGSTVRQWDDVLSLGSDSGDLTRTLADDTRFKVRGSGGTVYIEAGDPSPDNSGGTMVLGGWNGTDADSVTINATVVNADGELQERGKKLIGIVQTEKTTFSAASTVDIALSENQDGVRAWEIEIEFVQSASANLYGRFSFDGGSNYKSGASDYDGQFITGAPNSLTITNQTAADHMELAQTLQGATNKPARGTLRIETVDSGSDWTTLRGTIVGLNTTPRVAFQQFFYATATTYGRATHLRLYPASGTMTGSYMVKPLYGFGEA